MIPIEDATATVVLDIAELPAGELETDTPNVRHDQMLSELLLCHAQKVMNTSVSRSIKS